MIEYETQLDNFDEIELYLFQVKFNGRNHLKHRMVLGSRNAILMYFTLQKQADVDACRYFIATEVDDVGVIGWAKMNEFGYDDL
jgi:hypothetical protein